MKLEVLPLPFRRPPYIERFADGSIHDHEEHWSLRATRVATDAGKVFTVFTTFIGPHGFETMAQNKEEGWLEDLTQRTEWSAPELFRSEEEGYRHHAIVIAKLLAAPEPVDENFNGVQIILDWMQEHPAE